ncbi:alpha/beta fold hydrolase [Gluconacetobacter diazotrophicus]|uniref:Alpha/beta fold hydrolase n=1 Tax=Gluconacetobacter diazotrophicus TaxID=33996 RepID=A0A7W4I8X7_GLUDI|nr:alpha/beta fold hydrolase [Gluconacetobacter diazotrophicus]MBB2158401.1 alpha/beta fold hydrolase [Gluconacetobacter diazotrophicus]
MTSSNLNIVRGGPAEGGTVVLIHAVGLDLTYWDRQIEALTAHYHVVALDLPGHGRSARPSHNGRIADLAHDVAMMINDLGPLPVHVVGHSFGGMIAQELAISYPDRIRSLTLAATAASFSEEVRDYLRDHGSTARAQGMISALPSLPLSLAGSTLQRRPDLLERLTKTTLAMDSGVYAAAWSEIADFDAADRLGSIQCPTLLLVGEEDRNTPPAVSALIARAISGAEVVVIPEASHMVPLEAAERFNRELLRFLRDVEA